MEIGSRTEGLALNKRILPPFPELGKRKEGGEDGCAAVTGPGVWKVKGVPCPESLH